MKRNGYFGKMLGIFSISFVILILILYTVLGIIGNDFSNNKSFNSKLLSKVNASKPLFFNESLSIESGGITDFDVAVYNSRDYDLKLVSFEVPDCGRLNPRIRVIPETIKSRTAKLFKITLAIDDVGYNVVECTLRAINFQNNSKNIIYSHNMFVKIH